jgi:hypothetical protein
MVYLDTWFKKQRIPLWLSGDSLRAALAGEVHFNADFPTQVEFGMFSRDVHLVDALLRLEEVGLGFGPFEVERVRKVQRGYSVVSEFRIHFQKHASPDSLSQVAVVPVEEGVDHHGVAYTSRKGERQNYDAFTRRECKYMRVVLQCPSGLK